MKRILLLCLCLMICFTAQMVFAQAMPNDVDPQTAQAIQAAIQRGDTQAAKKIYEDSKNSKNSAVSPPVIRPKPVAAEGPSVEGLSVFEKFLPGIQQFGYETFLKTAASFAPAVSLPVGPDYTIGAGDQFTITLWGTTEGIYALTVTKEGNITLPKVGVVSVAGLKFGELENTLRRHLSRYYSNFNLSVAMGSLKTITVYVVGEVDNPGSYSLPSLSTVYSALFVAGGPTKKGTLRTIQVLRSGKVLRTLDLYDFLLKGDRSQDMRLQHEDTVFVPLIGPIAGVSGAVYRPAIYELRGNETIGAVIQTAGGIMPVSLASRIQLTRFSDNQKKVVLDIQVPNPQANTKGGELKEKVGNMDLIHVLPIYDQVWETVNLHGDVGHPGDFQWRQDLRLKEIIQEGQLLPTADLQRAEVIRLTDDFMDRKIIPINLSLLLSGDEAQNLLLRPKDQIRVYTLYRAVEKVTVAGEVMSPGEYEIQKGERLSDLLRRVGGFTKEAYAYGAIFKRTTVKETQTKNSQTLISKLQSHMLQTASKGAATASSPEETTYAKAELSVNQELLANLKTVQESLEGRIALTITENMDEWTGSKDDLLLQKGDAITIPKRPQEVLVLGEVYSPGAQIYQPEMSLKDYIDNTGGMTKYSEAEEIFVIQANGFAFGKDSPHINNKNIEKVKLKAGDVVFVPQKVERYAGMRFAKDIIDILFKTAVIIATVAVLHL